MSLLGSKPKSINQAGLVQKLTKCITNLINVVEQENKALAKGAGSNLEHILGKKTESLKELNELDKELHEFLQISPLQKDDQSLPKLKELFEKMNEVNRKNEILLKMNIEISDKIMEIYKSSRTDNVIRQLGYNSQGTQTASKNLEKIMPSLTLNNKI